MPERLGFHLLAVLGDVAETYAYNLAYVFGGELKRVCGTSADRQGQGVRKVKGLVLSAFKTEE